MTTGKRLTPAAANAELPLVRAIVADVVHATARVREIENAYRAERARVQPSQTALNEGWRAKRALLAEREAQIAELRTLSVEFDDVESGQVRFLGTLDGNAVFLCWKLGEPRVDTWRDDGQGFDERRPLPEPVLA